MLAILTYFQTDNYGGIFQAFSLQHVITSLGGDSRIINYKCKGISKRNTKKVLYHLQKANGGRAKLKYIVNKAKTLQHFRRFRNRHFLFSNRIRKNLAKLDSFFEKYISGSDQIWNTEINDGDDAYFLNFTRKRKYAYSASFGSPEILSIESERMKKLLTEYRFISTREDYSHQLDNLLEKKIQVTLDPVLLLNQKDWEDLFSLKLRMKYYVLVFITGTPLPGVLEYVKEQYKCDIVYINNTSILFDGMENCLHASPEEWLDYIYNADVIITNSYHGSLFSCIFEKKLVFVYSTYTFRFSHLVNHLEINGTTIKLKTGGQLFCVDFKEHRAHNGKLILEQAKSRAFLSTILTD